MKQVAITEEAHEMLYEEKLYGETYSEVIIRMIKLSRMNAGLVE